MGIAQMKNVCIAITGVMLLTLMRPSAHAASIQVDDQRILASQNNTVWGHNENVPYNVSLNSSNPGYAGLFPNDSGGNDAAPFEQDITEEIQGWLFVGGGNNVLNSTSESGGLITMSTTDDTFDSFQQSSPQLWIGSDPGNDLLSPATGRDLNPGGYRGIQDVSGSIDISGLQSGTVYFFYGAYNSAPSITASMKDTDGPEPDIDVPDFHNGDGANRKEMYVASLTFVNDSGYETIDYDFTSPNGRWGGMVVSGTVINAPVEIVLTITRANAEAYDVSWPSQSNRVYKLWSSPDLMLDISAWNLVEEGIFATPPTNTVRVTPPQTVLKSYYRVEE